MSAERITVPPEAGGERLDRFIAAVVGTRSAAERAIAAGRVSVDGALAGKSLRLSGGELIVIEPDQTAPRPVAALVEVPVVYEDEHLLVVDKPAGVVTHPGPGVTGSTLVAALAGWGIGGGGDADRPGIVHRLDRDTTGLLVVARDEPTHEALVAALARREIERRYLALAHGRPPSRTGTIEAPIGRDPNDIGRMAIEGRNPRPAVTHFELEEALPTTTLLRVRLETGRTHQIRVHLAAIGHGVMGDPTYGIAARHLGLQRQFLHAAELAFEHPATGEPLRFRSELPEDLAAALVLAREL